MASATYRYQWSDPALSEVAQSLDPSLVVTKAGPAPAPVVDITLSDDGANNKSDLDAVMAVLGWTYQSTNPPNPPQGVIIRQELSTKLLVDDSTTSAVFVDLLSIPIETEVGVLTVIASACSTNLITLGYLRITIDGIPVAGGAHDLGTQNMFLAVRVPITAGAHTVTLRWRVDALGTQSARPVTFPEAEFATLLVREMNA